MVRIRRTVLVTLCLAMAAEGAGGGGHNQHAGHTDGHHSCSSPPGPWFDTHLDFFHLENWILALIVVLAVLFELLWHTITHALESDHHNSASWIATAKEHEFHRTIEEAAKEFTKLSKSLWMTLVERTSGELMVLGFLALVLWAMARGEFFHWTACALRSGNVDLPHSSHEYLEMVEDVHMHLFLTMVTFISIVGVAITFVHKQLHQWAQSNNTVCDATAKTMLAYAYSQTPGAALDPKAILALLPEGAATRDFFFFARSRRLLFKRVNTILKNYAAHNSDEVHSAECSIIRESLQEITATLNGQRDRPEMSFNQDYLSETMAEWFPFHAYLKLQCHHLLEDMIEVKVLTWLYLAVGLLVSANILRLSLDLTWLWVVKGFQLLVSLSLGVGVPLYMKSRRQEKAVSLTTQQVIANANSIRSAIDLGRKHPAHQQGGTEQPEEAPRQPEGAHPEGAHPSGAQHRQPEGAHPEGAHPSGAHAEKGEDAKGEHAEEEEVEEEEETLKRLGFCLHVQDFPMFSIQMFLFYWCYFCVRLIAGKYWWHNHLPYALTALVVLLLTIPVAGYLVSKIVILLAIILARGDGKLKKNHLHWIFGFAEEYLHQLRRHQRREAGGSFI